MTMRDNTRKTDKRDRSRVAGKQKYEAQFFAQEAGISIQQARDLIDRFGHDRETLLREASHMLKQMS